MWSSPTSISLVASKRFNYLCVLGKIMMIKVPLFFSLFWGPKFSAVHAHLINICVLVPNVFGPRFLLHTKERRLPHIHYTFAFSILAQCVFIKTTCTKWYSTSYNFWSYNAIWHTRHITCATFQVHTNPLRISTQTLSVFIACILKLELLFVDVTHKKRFSWHYSWVQLYML
jgi:hypothetical protein